MFNTLGNSISTDWARRYLFDGSGNSTTGSNNATVTNPVWVKSEIGYQAQCLSWGASTSCTYASVTYTNSYIWIYTGGAWVFTKNSAKVTATSLNGVNGERYALLTFFNRTLTADEEQLLILEGRRILGPTNIAKYPALLSGLVGYWDFRGSAHNLVDGSLATVTGATLTQDRFGNSNSAYSFTAPGNRIVCPGLYTTIKTIGNIFTISMDVKITNLTGGKVLFSETSGASVLYLFVSASGKIRILRGGVFSDETGNSLSSIGVYKNITISFTSSTNCALYIDGVFVQNLTVGATDTTGSLSDLTIGNYFSGDLSSFFYNGIIDNFKVFNRAISSDEASLLYKLTSQDYIYPTPSYDLASLRDGLVLDLNEQGYDLSGNGNNGTLVGAPAIVRQGRAKGLSYNGSNQYVNISDITLSNITISAIFKTSNKSQATGIVSKLNIIGTNTLEFNVNMETDGRVRFWITQNGSNVINIAYSKSIDYADGKWHTATVVANGSQLIVYVDGIPGTPIAQSGPIFNSTASISIGGWFNGGSITGVFNGQIISPKIRNRALSDKEIQALYYSQKGSFIY